MVDILFLGIYALAILHVIFAEKLYSKFARPSHERLASEIVSMRITMMQKPVMARQEDLKLIARLEAQYQFLTGEINIKRPMKGLDEIEKEKEKIKAEVVPLRRVK